MALGHFDQQLTLPSWHELIGDQPCPDDAAERCRAALNDWDADPFPTEYVQVEASLLRAVLDRLEAAEASYLDLRSGHELR
jgi:hypothetical protein